MSTAIELAIRDIRLFISAGEKLTSGIAENNAAMLEDVLQLSNGMTMTESMNSRNSAARSRHMTALLDEFEEVRRRTRLSVTVAALAEGMTLKQLGSAFGVSPQLASRIARDARSGI